MTKRGRHLALAALVTAASSRPSVAWASCSDSSDVVGYSRCSYHAYGRSFGPSPFDVDLDAGAFHAWLFAGDRPTPLLTARGALFGSGALRGSFDGGTVSADLGLTHRLYVPISLAIGVGHVTADNHAVDSDVSVFAMLTGAGLRVPLGGASRLRLEVDLGVRQISPSNRCGADDCLTSIVVAPMIAYDFLLSDYWRLTAHVSTNPLGGIPFEAGVSVGVSTQPMRL